jgi:hypothetical protein
VPTGSRTASGIGPSLVRSRALRIFVIAIATAVVAILAFPAFLALRAAGSAVFEPEPFDFVLLGAAAFGIAIGVQVVPWRSGRRIALLALFASAALLFAILAMFSIGLAVLPLAIVLVVVLFRALRRAPANATRAAAALGGAAIGYSAVLLCLALIVPATAECFPNGGGTSSGRWGGSRQQQYSGGGSGVGGQPGAFTGHAEYGDSVVTFRCEGGRMVEFQRAPR